ncbi:putative nuclease HARBI1 [Pleurodeles waltl]|uniref:putative nuclease HARBI1 n=1 Tax=Pleurodeles waltl TaxID=8319 RepID=UPI0037093E37
MSQPMFSFVLEDVLSALLKHIDSYIRFPQCAHLPTVKADFYDVAHIPHVTGVMDGTHIALIAPRINKQVLRNQKNYHSINVQVVCLADQYISQVTANFPGSVHDYHILRNSNVSRMMAQLQSERAWIIGDSGYPNLSWLLTPVRYPRSEGKNLYNEAHGRTRRVTERMIGLLKAKFRCLQISGGSLLYSPKKVCQIVVACCMLHNLSLRRHVPLLEEEEVATVVVADEGANDSDEDHDDEDDVHSRTQLILQYFQ